MQQKPDFKSAFLALMEEQSPGEHPTGEALAAYRSGELAAGERAKVHRHLAGCRECSELARDLDLFTEAPTPAKNGNELQVTAFLRALTPLSGHRRAKAPRLASDPSPATATRSPRRGTTHTFRPLAMAASLILAVATSWWLSRDLTRRQMSAELSRPRANVSIRDLVEDRSERTGSPAETVEVPTGSGTVLVLTPDRPGEFPAYQAKILSSAGALVTTFEAVEKDPDSETFTLWIPPAGLTPGDYLVELFGHSGTRAEVIAGYRIRVVASPEAPP